MKKINFKKISVHEVPGQSPGLLLWHVSTAWRGSIEQTLKPFALTHPQFVILAAIGWLTRKGDQVTQAQIGLMAGLDPNTVSQILKGLEQKELIRRAPSTDARAKNPQLTEKGSKILASALPAVEAKDNAFFQSLTAREMERLILLFHQLIPHSLQ